MKPMRLIIAGGRDFNNFELALQKLNLIQKANNITEIVSGGARGADQIGERLAAHINIPLQQYLANWNLHGKSAGYKRNIVMAHNADALLAFWDGKSKGTSHMINVATTHKLPVTIVRY